MNDLNLCLKVVLRSCQHCIIITIEYLGNRQR